MLFSQSNTGLGPSCKWQFGVAERFRPQYRHPPPSGERRLDLWRDTVDHGTSVNLVDSLLRILPRAAREAPDALEDISNESNYPPPMDFTDSEVVAQWFSAAILGSYLSDPISEHIGRRGALFIAAICSFGSVIGASRTQSWQELLITRIVLGLGIGGKASVVPILESEVVPAAKRGRLLVGWQVFVATGLFAGYTASYIFRDNWRHQILTGAIPAFALLLFTWVACESPRWLIIQGKYDKAFETLVRLRKERILAAKELCSIYYQIQAERWLFSGQKVPDVETEGSNPREETEDMNPFDPELGTYVFFVYLHLLCHGLRVLQLSAAMLDRASRLALSAFQAYYQSPISTRRMKRLICQ